jgi:hypothetical protein
MRRRVAKHRRGDRRDVAGVDPAGPCVAYIMRDGTWAGTADLRQHRQVLHERRRVKMRVAEPRALDIRLDHLVPGEMDDGRIRAGVNADMNEVRRPGRLRAVDRGLGLRQHLDVVAGQHQHAVDPLHRRDDRCQPLRLGVVEIERADLDPLFGERPQSVGPTCRGDEPDARRNMVRTERLDHRPADAAGGAEHEDGGNAHGGAAGRT